jgi:hypothetical protein
MFLPVLPCHDFFIFTNQATKIKLVAKIRRATNPYRHLILQVSSRWRIPMKFARSLALISSLFAIFVPSMPAATFATLNCAGATTLSLPLEAFTFEYNGPTSTSPGLFTVYTDIANLNTLIVDLLIPNSASFSTCSVSSDSIASNTSVSGVHLENVTAAGAGPGLTSAGVGVVFAGATFSFSGISAANGPPSATSPAANLTPEERKKAVDAFQARGLALPSTSK